MSLKSRWAVMLGIFAFGTIFLRAASAHASDPKTYVLTLEFDTPPDEQPDHLCIISAGASLEWDHVLADHSIGPPGASWPISKLAGLKTDELEADAERTAGTWYLDASAVAKAALPGGALASRPYIASALAAAALQPKPKSDGGPRDCRAGGSVCAPRFSISSEIQRDGSDTEKLHIMCRPDVRPPAHGPSQRVAIVFINTHTGLHPPFRALTLDGSIASVQMEGAIANEEVFVASVLGGHYAMSSTFASVGRRVVLALQPRCHPYDIELPYHDGRSDPALTANLREGGKLLESCLARVVDGHTRVDLPNRPNIELRSLELAAKTSPLRFTAEWSDRTPPQDLKAKLRGVSFDWSVHCLYPISDGCPVARLTDSGYWCEGSAVGDNVCRYACDAGSGTVPIRFPETVQFTRRKTNETWQSRLTYSGEVVDEYVPSAERTIRLETPAASTLATLSIDSVELMLPNGENKPVKFKPDSHKSMVVPDVLCSQNAVVRYVGPVPYAPTTEKLEGGVLRAGDPEERYLSFDERVLLGAGQEFKARWAGDNEVIQGVPEGAFVSLGVTFRWQRWGSLWFLEFPYEITGGRREYLVQDAAGARAEHGAPLVRGMLGADIGIRLGGSSLSLEAAGGLSSAILLSNQKTLPLHGVFAPALRARFHLGGNTSVSIVTRVYFLEQTRIVDTNDSLVGTLGRNRGSFELQWDYSLGSWLAGLFASHIRDQDSDN